MKKRTTFIIILILAVIAFFIYDIVRFNKEGEKIEQTFMEVGKKLLEADEEYRKIKEEEELKEKKEKSEILCNYEHLNKNDVACIIVAKQAIHIGTRITKKHIETKLIPNAIKQSDFFELYENVNPFFFVQDFIACAPYKKGEPISINELGDPRKACPKIGRKE